MNERRIIYKPVQKKASAWICSMAVIVAGILNVILWGDIEGRIAALFVNICTIWGIAELVLLSSLRIQVSYNEVAIENRLFRSMLSVDIKSFAYGYFIYNDRGHLYLVLSPVELSPNAVRTQQKRGYRSLLRRKPQLTAQKCLSIIVSDHRHKRRAQVEACIGKSIVFMGQKDGD